MLYSGIEFCMLRGGYGFAFAQESGYVDCSGRSVLAMPLGMLGIDLFHGHCPG